MNIPSNPGSLQHTTVTTPQYQYTGPTKQVQSRLRATNSSSLPGIHTTDHFHGALYKYAIQGD